MIRARDLKIPFDGETGKHNAITDVEGVEVGHVTLIEGDGPLEVGQGPVRTGVTAILPRGMSSDPVFAGTYSLNGNGELTGTIWVEESGFLEGPVMITNTHSVGVVRDAVVAWQVEQNKVSPLPGGVFWSLPVVGETYDGGLNDINGFHVKAEHAFQALDAAESGPVAEGCVGGGTGMMCHHFKGGIGTSSRVVKMDEGEFTIGVLVQANYGMRKHLMIGGAPVGRDLDDLMPEINGFGGPPNPEMVNQETGSIIVVLATDAPLLPHQLKRLARRVPIGIGRVGGMGGNGSGDIFIAFSTANAGAAKRDGVMQTEMLSNDKMSELFDATAFATEEAIINAMVAAETMVGINGNKVHALPHARLQEALRKYGRLVE
ncbi:MAG: P1 family peptidase [Anaerolineae bacterium]